MARWRENHREYLLATARSLALTDEQFHAVSDDVGEIVLEEVRQAFGSAAPWWRNPPQRNLPYWGRRMPEDQSFRLITRVVPDPSETVWFLALNFDENGLVFEAVPSAIEQLLGETQLFEYVVVSKQLDWLLGEEDHSVFVGLGCVVEKLQAIVGPSVG